METPLYQAIKAYCDRAFARFHTPGHKGGELGPLTAVTPWDITEIRGADSLFHAEGAILELEQALAECYGTARSCISAGGSTLCIQAMLALVANRGKKIILPRNAHASAVSAMGLLGLEPVWCYLEQGEDDLPRPMTPQQAEGLLSSHTQVAALYVTSPDYFGKCADIAGLAQVAHRHGVPLLVDNAHGAALHLVRPSMHPMDLGADLCCDSLHKTLPVLTGGALLHVGSTQLSRGEDYAGRAKDAMALFGSTSPSYLVMLSIDQLLPWMQSGAGAAEVQEAAHRTAALLQRAAKQGFALPAGVVEPTRLSLGFGALGYTAQEFDALLTAHGIEPEYLSEHYCVLLLSARNRPADFLRLEALIDSCAPKRPALHMTADYLEAERVMSLRQAMLSPRILLPLEQCRDRVCAQIISRCPPGIALCMYGEKLDKNLCAVLKRYGITQLYVVQ